MTAFAGGIELGAMILAAAVLIGFVLIRPTGQTPTRRCYFDGHVVLGDGQEIGGGPCTGDPDYRYVYLKRAETGINVSDLTVCSGHFSACGEFVESLQRAVERAEAS